MEYEDDFVDQSIEIKSNDDDENDVINHDGDGEDDEEIYEDDDVDDDDGDDDGDDGDNVTKVMKNGNDDNDPYILYENECFETFDNNDDDNYQNNNDNNNNVNENSYLIVGQSFDINDYNHSNYYDGSSITSSIDYGK